MKRLLRNISILVLLVGTTSIGLLLIPIPSSVELAAFLNKRDLLKQDTERRIIFVGGSGLFDGLDSAMVRDTLQRPVVNMGLYAGFGIFPILREIKPHLKAGDTIVVIPEYGLVLDSYNEQSRKWLFVASPLENFSELYLTTPKGAEYFFKDLHGVLNVKLTAIPRAVREARKRGNANSFFTDGFLYFHTKYTDTGDSLMTFRPLPNEHLDGRGGKLLLAQGFRDQSFERVNQFYRYARGKGVQMFFIFPAYPAREYRELKEEIHQYYAKLRRELDIPILGTPQDFIFSDRFFTDTVNHINKEAKKARTERVIALLQRQSVSDYNAAKHRLTIVHRD